MSADAPSTLRSLGACPRCGRERLEDTKFEPIAGRMGVQRVVYVSCGACPTERTTFLPPDDSDAPVDPF